MGNELTFLESVAPYAYYGLTIFLVVFLYGYIYHLFRNEKKHIRDYEKYKNIVIKDSLSDKPIEPIKK